MVQETYIRIDSSGTQNSVKQLNQASPKPCCNTVKWQSEWNSCGAEEPSSEKTTTILNANDQKGSWKAQSFFVFFPIHIISAILGTRIIQPNFSCVRLNETKTILKNRPALVSYYIKPEHILKMPCFCKLVDNLWLRSSELKWNIG